MTSFKSKVQRLSDAVGMSRHYSPLDFTIADFLTSLGKLGFNTAEDGTWHKELEHVIVRVAALNKDKPILEVTPFTHLDWRNRRYLTSHIPARMDIVRDYIAQWDHDYFCPVCGEAMQFRKKDYACINRPGCLGRRDLKGKPHQDVRVIPV